MGAGGRRREGAAVVIIYALVLGVGVALGWLLAAETMVHHARRCTSCRVYADRIAKCRGGG